MASGLIGGMTGTLDGQPAAAPTPAPVPAPGLDPSVFVFWPGMFDSSQTVTTTTSTGGKIVEKIPPQYCATMALAVIGQAWLATQGITVSIVMRWPLYQNQGQNAANVQSAQVPYYDDGKGAVENVADLFDEFNDVGPHLATLTVLDAFTLDDTPQS